MGQPLPISLDQNYLVLASNGQFAGASSSFCELQKCTINELLLESEPAMIAPFRALVSELAVSDEPYKVRVKVVLPKHLANYSVEAIVSSRLIIFLLIAPLPQPPIQVLSLADFNCLLHDLHNLLGCVIANRQLLEQELTEAEVKRLLAVSLLANTKAEGLILASLHQPPLQKVFLLKRLTEETVASLFPLLGRVECKVTSKDDEVVLADGGASFNRILSNLILNSCNAIRRYALTNKQIEVATKLVKYLDLPSWIKSAPAGKSSVKEESNYLYLHHHQITSFSDYYLEIKVKDNGGGTQLHRVQSLLLDQQPTGVHGYGLASVRSLLADQGGWQLRSHYGKDTSFTCYLPVEFGLPQPAEQVLTKQAASGHQIAVIDDDQLMRITLQAVLRQLGYSAFLITGLGQLQALSQAVVTSLNLVILDLSVLEGKEKKVITELKRLNPELKIVITSGDLLSEKRQLLTSCQVDHFLPKPFDKATLQEILTKLLTVN